MYDIATRASIVILKAYGGKTTPEVGAALGIPSRTVDSIYSKAIKRGFDPNVRPVVILDKFLEDAPRSGRPMKQTEETKTKVISKSRGYQHLFTYRVADPQELWVQKDEANEETWSDEGDEEGSA